MHRWPVLSSVFIFTVILFLTSLVLLWRTMKYSGQPSAALAYRISKTFEEEDFVEDIKETDTPSEVSGFVVRRSRDSCDAHSKEHSDKEGELLNSDTDTVLVPDLTVKKVV